jgi:UPF0716 protein FxsA
VGKLFLLFVIMPIMEIAVLINVGEIIGGWNTVLLVILSAMIGAYLVKREGLATLAQAQQKMAQGEVPAAEIGSGLLLLIAGVLLVTPGFITDIFGLLLTLPMTRQYLAQHVVKLANVQTFGNMHGGGFSGGFTPDGTERDPFNQPQRPRNQSQDDIIEGEYTDTENKNNKRLD